MSKLFVVMFSMLYCVLFEQQKRGITNWDMFFPMRMKN